MQVSSCECYFVLHHAMVGKCTQVVELFSDTKRDPKLWDTFAFFYLPTQVSSTKGDDIQGVFRKILSFTCLPFQVSFNAVGNK